MINDDRPSPPQKEKEKRSGRWKKKKKRTPHPTPKCFNLQGNKLGCHKKYTQINLKNQGSGWSDQRRSDHLHHLPWRSQGCWLPLHHCCCCSAAHLWLPLRLLRQEGG